MIRKALKNGENFFDTEENQKKFKVLKELTDKEKLKKKNKMDKLTEIASLKHKLLQYPKNEKKDDDKR